MKRTGGKPRVQIAIDGTAGSGKTTIGQMLAIWLDCPYLDTGAMYRAVALLALRSNCSLNDPEALARLAGTMDFASRDATSQEAADGRQYTVLLKGEDISREIRTPGVESIVSTIAAVPQVRVELVSKQRQIANRHEVIILIGRDIGSVVLPSANLKMYLDASPEVRAKRRSLQAGSGIASSEQARQGLLQRDQMDIQRVEAPLVVADGALVINTDGLTPEEVLVQIKKALIPHLI